MPYSLADKLVVAIASSALFDLSESGRVFEDHGEDAYRAFQRANQAVNLRQGVAFAFVRRLLSLNTDLLHPRVEVILLSKNDSDTGLRVFNSIKHYGLPISRGALSRGQAPYPYIPAFKACLFLSANKKDVMEAIDLRHPAGLVLETNYVDDPNDPELRVAFDFDGVLADDESEVVYHQTKDLDAYFAAETALASKPHRRGPLNELLSRLAALQKADAEDRRTNPGAQPRIRIAIVTARNAPAHERMINSLRTWDITVDDMFLLGGVEKKAVLEVFRPHIFFDDQRDNLDPSSETVPSVHIPFGVANRPLRQSSE
jgi:5'-nucleotidase